MTYENFTIVAQNALKTASTIAKTLGHSELDNGHILKGILDYDEQVYPFLFRRMEVNIETVKTHVESIVNSYLPLKTGNMIVSAFVNKALNIAKQYSTQMSDEFISIEHILLGLINCGDSVSNMLKNNGLNEEKLKKAILEMRKGIKIENRHSTGTLSVLTKYANNLNDKVKAGKIDPVIGRDDEIRKMLQILSRRRKNNPMITGEAGVGKTAVVEGLAQRIVRGDIPENLKNCQIWNLDITMLLAGASQKGDFEERLKNLIQEVISSNGEIILFIDEIHTLVGAGGGGGSMDAANILKPALARGELKLIGATTTDEYQKYIERDKALERRFQVIKIEEPQKDICISILRGIKEKFENHHQIKIKDEALIAAVELSSRYLTDRYLPDKAIDLIDEASAKLRIELNSLPEEIDTIEREMNMLNTEKEILRKDGDKERMNSVIQKLAELSDKRNSLRAAWETERDILSKISKERLELENLQNQVIQAEKDGDFQKVAVLKTEKITKTETKLKELDKLWKNASKNGNIFSDEVNKDLIAEMVSEWTGIPIQKMLQSEKERLLKLEEELRKRVIGQEEALVAVCECIRRSRTGLQTGNKPIGSFLFVGTTGVGKTELAKALASFLFSDEKQLIRLDMSEYMESNSVNKLIGSPPGYIGHDEGGQLTDSVRNKPFSVVLLDEMEKAHKDVFNVFLQVLDDGRLTDSKGRTVDFKNTIIIMTSNTGADIINKTFANNALTEKRKLIFKTKLAIAQHLKKTISPEFLNRIDDTVLFVPLQYAEVRQITELQVKQLQKQLLAQNIQIYISKYGMDWIAQMGYSPQFGARPVKRVIQKYVISEISNKILLNEIDHSKIIYVDYQDGKLKFESLTPDDFEKRKQEATPEKKIEIPNKEDDMIEEEVKEEVKKEETPLPDTSQTQEPEKKKGFWSWLKSLFGAK